MVDVIKFIVGLIGMLLIFPFILLAVALILPVFILFHLILITGVVLVSLAGFFIFIYHLFKWETSRKKTKYSSH